MAGNLSSTLGSRDTKDKETPHKAELTFGSRVEFQHHEGVRAPGRVSCRLLVIRNILLHGVPPGKRGAMSGTAPQGLVLRLGLREHVLFNGVVLVTGTVLLLPL